MPNTPSYQLSWDASGERFYETGVKRGVLYPYDSSNHAYGAGVAWNGLTGYTETPSGADATALYADDIKYLELRAAEDFGATIEAYTYPDEWAECDGSKELLTGVTVGQQARKMFGFSCVTTLGNDSDGNAHGYKIHLVYNATASPSERAYSTINDSPEAITFSWEISTTPIDMGSGFKPAALITIDSTKVDATKLANLEQILYGTPADGQTAAVAARLPLPAEVISTLT